MSKILNRIAKSIIKKFLYIFFNNPNLLKLLNLTLYEFRKDRQIFLKENLGHKYIVHANDIVSKNFFNRENILNLETKLKNNYTDLMIV